MKLIAPKDTNYQRNNQSPTDAQKVLRRNRRSISWIPISEEIKQRPLHGIVRGRPIGTLDPRHRFTVHLRRHPLVKGREAKGREGVHPESDVSKQVMFSSMYDHDRGLLPKKTLDISIETPLYMPVEYVQLKRKR